MTEFFLDYGLFLAKTVTIVIAIAAVVVFFVAMAGRKQADGKDTLEVKKINKKYEDMAMALNTTMLPKDELKKYLKEEKQKQKLEQKGKLKGKDEEEERKRIYVVNFQGDIRASAVSSLREEITAILTVAAEKDEVFMRLESSGGVVHGYGLAASQMMRVRDKNIPLTVSVDKVAASGGYMMACVANRILAAPFAIIGSIGVIAQIPNFHKVLKKHDVSSPKQSAAAPSASLAPTERYALKFREEIEDIHVLFKDFIKKHRPGIDIVKVSTGESWPGTRALENNLVDELKTSDDYLLENSRHADIYEVSYVSKKPVLEKIGLQVQRLFDKWQYG